MIYIKMFEDFNQLDTLHIFDFDKTLVKTPNFDDLVVDYLGESVTIEDLIKKSLEWINVSISELKIDNGRIYVDDQNNRLNIKGNWVRKGERVYLVTPNKFHNSDLYLPTGLAKLSRLYKEVSNKSIVTGRSKSHQYQVEETLEKFGLEFPNYGLFCYPYERFEKIAEWKAKTIVKLLKDTGFKKAKFYDDRPKWVKTVVRMVKSELPDIEFEGIRVYE